MTDSSSSREVSAASSVENYLFIYLFIGLTLCVIHSLWYIRLLHSISGEFINCNCMFYLIQEDSQANSKRKKKQFVLVNCLKGGE